MYDIYFYQQVTIITWTLSFTKHRSGFMDCIGSPLNMGLTLAMSDIALDVFRLPSCLKVKCFF